MLPKPTLEPKREIYCQFPLIHRIKDLHERQMIKLCSCQKLFTCYEQHQLNIFAPISDGERLLLNRVHYSSEKKYKPPPTANSIIELSAFGQCQKSQIYRLHL